MLALFFGGNCGAPLPRAVGADLDNLDGSSLNCFDLDVAEEEEAAVEFFFLEGGATVFLGAFVFAFDFALAGAFALALAGAFALALAGAFVLAFDFAFALTAAAFWSATAFFFFAFWTLILCSAFFLAASFFAVSLSILSTASSASLFFFASSSANFLLAFRAARMDMVLWKESEKRKWEGYGGGGGKNFGIVRLGMLAIWGIPRVVAEKLGGYGMLVDYHTESLRKLRNPPYCQPHIASIPTSTYVRCERNCTSTAVGVLCFLNSEFVNLITKKNGQKF